jgi:hypothetical protein
MEDLIPKEDTKYRKHPARDAYNDSRTHLRKPQSRTPGHARFKKSNFTDKQYICLKRHMGEDEE